MLKTGTNGNLLTKDICMAFVLCRGREVVGVEVQQEHSVVECKILVKELAKQGHLK